MKRSKAGKLGENTPGSSDAASGKRLGQTVAGGPALPGGGGLEAWLSQEGIETGARQVCHIEFDSNWSDAFHVVLRESIEGRWVEFMGGGPGMVGGLQTAIAAALAKARGESDAG